jgi:hypothetical protein
VTTRLWVLMVVAVAFVLLRLAPKPVEFDEMVRAVLAALRYLSGISATEDAAIAERDS